MTQQQFTQLKQAHSYYKSSELDWEVDTYIWQDDAACLFLPSTMFEVAQEGDPIAEGLDQKEIKDLNSANIEAAQRVCAKCPVWHMCYATADSTDFLDTVRAGITPLRHNPQSQGRPRKRAAVSLVKRKSRNKIDLENPCARGHFKWKTSVSGKNYCATCKAENGKRYRKRKGPSGNPRYIIDHTKPCPNGHPVEFWTSAGRGKYRCEGCRRIKAGKPLGKLPVQRVVRDGNSPCKRGHMAWKRIKTTGNLRCSECDQLNRKSYRDRVGA